MTIEIEIYQGKKIIGKRFFSRQKITIGRGPDNDIVLSEKFVSRLHATLDKNGEDWTLSDHSANGTFVNNVRIKNKVNLSTFSKIEIYPFSLHCKIYQDETTVPIPEHPTKSTDDIAAEKIYAKPIDGIKYHFDLLVGEHPSMQKVYHLIERISKSKASVLIRGEHGTGKELVAAAIHQNSIRKKNHYIPLNCAAIPENLIESELFGYEKGTFTGAYVQKKGKIEDADGGTLFLDEIGELSMSGQAKLLRFLQERKFTRLGSSKEIEVDVRIISATNKNLEQAIQENRFRPDLYFRLRVVQIEIPSLKDRLFDIPILIHHFLLKLSKEYGLHQLPIITKEAMERLCTYHWPGNIRQLENVIISSFLKAGNPGVIDTDNLDIDMDSGLSVSIPPTFDEISKQTLIQTLERCQWDTQKAAQILKVSRGTIYYKLKKYNIGPKLRRIL